MALYRLEAKIIGRGGSRPASAVAAAAYRSRSKLYDEQAGRWHDYSQLSGLVHSEISAPQGAASWVLDREKLANAIEAKENTHNRRATAQLCRELMGVLPRELSHAQHVALVRRYVTEELVARGMVVDWSIHDSPAADGGRNPHVHMLCTMRRLDEAAPHGFGIKAREWNAYFTGETITAAGPRQMLRENRSAWGRMVNEALEDAGSAERVDHRSYRERGIERLPGIHLGKAHWMARDDRRELPGRYVDNTVISARNRLHEAEKRLGMPLGQHIALKAKRQRQERGYIPRRRFDMRREVEEFMRGTITERRYDGTIEQRGPDIDR